jgi:hypothetical protein
MRFSFKMKTFMHTKFMPSLMIALGLAAASFLTGCHTVHRAEHHAHRVAKKVAYGTGHVVHKVGSGIEHVGEKIERHTD